MPDFKKVEKVIMNKQEAKPVEEKVDHKDDFSESSLTRPAGNFNNRDFEIINSKLDLINSRLEHLNARLEALERIAYDEKRKW